jgi:hypothetical protein
MKQQYLLSSILLLALVTSFTACTKRFQEINTDPNLVNKDLIEPALLFSAVEKYAVFNAVNNQGILAEFAQYYKNPGSGDIFQVRNFSDPYNTFYRNYLINTAEVIRLTANNPLKVNENAIARIWRAWLYQQLTDAYGDIPYTEAVKDVNDLITQPKYDTQESIYTDLLKELKEASAQLTEDPNQLSFGNADLLLKGNVAGWKRFANSLRLRMAMRIRYANASLAQQHITEALSLPLIESNDQNIKMSTVNDGNSANSNQFYQKSLTSTVGLTVTFTLTDNLKKLNDPRLPMLAVPSAIPEAGYRGVPIQIGPDQKERYSNDSTARMPPSFLQPVIQLVIMNASEVKFLRAEAALAGLSGENAQTLFEEGIQMAMEQYNVDASAISSYLSSSSATLSGTDEQKLEQIIVQKWIGNYYNNSEAWAEFRRTGYPRIWTGSDLGDTEGNIPRRLTYPTDEYFRNEANVNEAASRLQGGDKLMSHVWWDKKPGLPLPHPRQGMFPPEAP